VIRCPRCNDRCLSLARSPVADSRTGATQQPAWPFVCRKCVREIESALNQIPEPA
jgi:DNA-directed RNA polymerase subunit RPC12/RpoP